MKLVAKIVVALLALYVLVVVAFETMLGFAQPRGENNLVITFTGDDGRSHHRVLSLFESDGELYLAANHWPRGWFHAVKRHPHVHIEFGGAHAAESGDYRLVEVRGSEHERVLADNRMPLAARLVMGFPPREFLHIVAEERSRGG